MFVKNELLTILDQLIRSSHQERLITKGIILIRVDMIVVASLLTRFVMEKIKINTIITSTGSLKEGVLAMMRG